VHDTGDLRHWQNSVSLKYQLNYRDRAHHITLKAIPSGMIRYSLDGSDPKYGAIYEDEIAVAEGWDKPVSAIAESSGIWSEKLPIALPRHGGEGQPIQIDPARPAEWRSRLKCQDRRRSFEVLAILKRFGA